jgi:hypothetical protein
MIHIALLHFPISDKRGQPICTSVTNLDVHDISRAATTYGLDAAWMVHPYERQRVFLQRVLRHWREGWGATYNPTRQEALARTELAADLGEVVERIEAETGRRPVLAGTSARPVGDVVTFREMRRRIETNPQQPHVIVLGTGWGLHPDILAELDVMIEPIRGPVPWNHLSVRAAAGIILDRLCSPDT